jgi:signal transduction histidine kinase
VPNGSEGPKYDGTALRFAWVVLLAIPIWLLFYWNPHQPGVGPQTPGVVLWGLYFLVVAVESFRSWLARKSPSHRILNVFPFFDALAISVTVRLTGGIESEFWLLYPLQLVAGALSPDPRALRLLGTLVVISYAAAVLPGLPSSDWSYFIHHLHLPGSLAALPSPSHHSESVSRLLVRFFFLGVVSAMARTLARNRTRQERELALLREQVAVASDRSRIARDLHDHLNHTLVASLLRLELCARLLQKSPEEAQHILGEEKSALRGALDAVRDYVFHLRPAELEQEAFEPLLRHYAQRFAERTGIPVSVEMEAVPEPRPVVKVEAVRIVQEALTNAAKHAQARNIRVIVKRDAGPSLVVSVRDDGVGFDPASSSDGVGLSSMRERAEALGGRCEIEARPGDGCRVTAFLPLSP